ncbi:potassium/proton antiporter [Bacteroides propionicifaciens]|uniref:potassium/proton antiporter n=1 Tax=Bacteroides propionicifaciens TaxID=392838 RepID=UPI0003772186|nr:potassium/proton antiporter [Bacteroides propionicifaciens]
MTFTAENILLIGSVLLFVSIVVSKTGYKFGVPTLLLFLVVGMVFGTDGIGLQFNDTGEAQFIGMVALSIILFSGGMDTKYKEIKPIIFPGIVLSTLGVLFTALLTGLFIFFISDMSWTNIHLPLTTSLLLAATMSSTDSASVFAILRSQKMNLKENLRPMLELESGSNDPMAFMLTIVLIQFIESTGMGPGTIALSFLTQFVVGGVVGYLLGKFLIYIINKIDIGNSSLYPILVVSFIFFTFSITDALKGNGYLAVYIAGMLVGNNKIVYRKEIASFMDGFSWLFQIIMFLTLGLLVNPHELLSIAPAAILIGVFMIVIGRPVSVFLCLTPFRKISLKAKHFVSWVGLRGAVPIIFATYPVMHNVPGANVIFNIVFFITILSLVIQGTSISFVANLLHLSTPLDDDSNQFGIELPEELNTHLFEVTVNDNMLRHGKTLKEVNTPQGTLVMLIKRDDQFLIPNGSLTLHVDDLLLLISEQDKTMTEQAALKAKMEMMEDDPE